jgi:hypothetical protein
MLKRAALLSVFALLVLPLTSLAQGAPPRAQVNEFPVDDPVIKAIWNEGMEHSQIYRLAQTLADSIGPSSTPALIGR